jgi:hypothetical protein
MKSRQDPKSPVFDRRLHTDPAFKRQFERWAQRMTGEEDFRPADLSDEYYDFIRSQILLARGGRPAQSAYEKARADLTPVLTAPQNDTPLADLALIWGLPEMQQLWADWKLELPASDGGKRRGPVPNAAGVKAVLAVLAMTGISTHVQDALAILHGNTDLREMFASLERLADGRARPSLPGLGAAPAQIEVPSYATVCRLIGQFAPQTISKASLARTRLLLSLRDYHPTVGQRWMIDGSDCPAWVPQKGARGGRGTDRDLQLRGRCPDAGFRAYMRKNAGPGGHAPIQSTDAALPAVRAHIIKSWRGYFLVALVDQATGQMGPLTLIDASTDEAPAIVPLLSRLHQHGHDLKIEIGAREIFGDSAWDEDPWCRVCLADYGIHPIFHHRSKTAKSRIIEPHELRDATIKKITGDGRLVCRQHDKQLNHGGLTMPSRAELRPGQASDPRAFRYRAAAENPCGCGKLSVPAELDFSKLLHHPHNPSGRPDLYAYRKAATDSLQAMESAFNRIKTGREVSTDGPARTRLVDKDSVQAIIELAALSQTALTVVDQRLRRGTPLSLAVPPSGTVATGEGTAEIEAA